jgi:hypothetical protein
MLAFFHQSSDYLCLLFSFLFLIRTGVDYDAGILVTNGKLCILAVSQFGYSLSWYVLDLLIIEVNLSKWLCTVGLNFNYNFLRCRATQTLLLYLISIAALAGQVV